MSGLRGDGDQDPGRLTDALTMHPTASREQWLQDPLFQACLLLPPTQGVAVPPGMLVAHCSAPWGEGTLGAVPKQPGPGGVGVGGQLSALSWKWPRGPAGDERHQSSTGSCGARAPSLTGRRVAEGHVQASPGCRLLSLLHTGNLRQAHISANTLPRGRRWFSGLSLCLHVFSGPAQAASSVMQTQ